MQNNLLTRPAKSITGRPPLQPGSAWGDRQRTLLLALVDADPGIHVLRAAHILGVNWNTCLHHVRRMAGEGTIVVAKVRGRLCLFDRNGTVARRLVHVLLRDPRTADIARLLVTTPGLNQKELAQELGIAPSAVHRHMRMLQSADLVERVRHGREVTNHPADVLREAWMARGRGDPTGAPSLEAPSAWVGTAIGS